MRNVLVLGLVEDPRAHLGHIARAFRMAEETLRLIRIQRDKEGLAAVVSRAPGGSERKLQGEDLSFAERLFGRDASLGEVKAGLAKRGMKVSIGMLSGVRAQWRASQVAKPAVESSVPSKAATASDESSVVKDAELANETKDAPEEDKGAEQSIDDVPARSGRFVQAVGTWLLLGMVNALGLYRAVETERARPERKGRRLRAGTVRVALDALIVALAVGQKCVEGVRRLQTATAGGLVSGGGGAERQLGTPGTGHCGRGIRSRVRGTGDGWHSHTGGARGREDWSSDGILRGQPHAPVHGTGGGEERVADAG
jgi:hypothetical protein